MILWLANRVKSNGTNRAGRISGSPDRVDRKVILLISRRILRIQIGAELRTHGKSSAIRFTRDLKDVRQRRLLQELLESLFVQLRTGFAIRGRNRVTRLDSRLEHFLVLA
jgi:hypothetical protein